MEGNRHGINNNPFISGNNTFFGGTYYQYNVANDGRKSSFDILREATAPNAFHDSNSKFDRPKCHPNTRIAVLRRIMNWARRCDRETWDKYIMWLTGAAGAGKSAITQSFIEMCLLNDLVLATFIFWRSDGTRNHAGAFVSTIAYQIYHAIPAAQKEILSVIDADPLVLTKELEHQFTQLVMKPLYNVCYSGVSSPLGSWRVIVIDGLDECGDGVMQARILNMIARAIRTFDLPILFLIASRPEHAINLAFRSNEMDRIFVRLYLDDTFHPDDDICTFLRDGFEEIKKSHPFKSLIPASWPSNEILNEIVRKSSGQFIYAATVLRYLQSIRHRPDHQLDVVNNLRPARGDLPFAQLDALYSMILNSARDTECVLYMLGIISHRVFEEDSDFDISSFMSLEPGELEILVCDLGAIVSVKKVSSRWLGNELEVVKILHTSLHDFLLDAARSGAYFLDIDTYRSEYIANIIQYLIKDPRCNEISTFEDFITRELPLCQSSTSLINIAEKFLFVDPILIEIEGHKKSIDYRTYLMDLRRFVFWFWLPFCARMAPLDECWAIIEKKHQRYLEQIFINELPHYYKDNEGILFLCVACHLGSDMCVPILSDNRQSIGRISNYDMLYLFESFALEDGKAHHLRNFVRFLQHPDQSDNYPIDPSAYAKAALHCVKQSWNSGYADEDKMLDALTFHNGQWTLNDTTSDYDGRMNFLLLGYMVFLLPRAGFSKRLIRQCEEETEKPFGGLSMNTFPRREALVRQEMRNYLDRVRS